MNDHVTISTFQLFQLFPDEETARLSGSKTKRATNMKTGSKLNWTSSEKLGKSVMKAYRRENEKMETETMTRPEQIAAAVAYGVLAYHRGIKRAPILDTHFQTVEYWADLPVMLAWLAGWDTANLSNGQHQPQ